MNYKVGDIESRPGEVAYGCLTAAVLASGTKVEVPVILVHGSRPGPVLYVEALCHGIEINGFEVLRRVLAQVTAAKLSGTIVAVPVTNPVALDHHIRQTYYDMEDMNRVWPGKNDGNISQRIAYTLWESAASKASCIIDLHTGCTNMMTHAVYAKDDEGSKSLAKVFGTACLVQEEANDNWKEIRFDGKLRNVATKAGIPSITPEMGGQRRFDEDPIAVGVRGVLNVLKYMKMIDGEPELVTQVIVKNAHLNVVKPTVGGIFVPVVKAGDRVLTGDVLGLIVNTRTLQVSEELKSTLTGLVVLVWDDPVMHAGDMGVMLGEIIEG